MSPIIAALAVGGITTLGKWARGQSLSVETIVGIVGVAVALVLIEQVNEKMASAFGGLAVLAVSLAHIRVIAEKAKGSL